MTEYERTSILRQVIIEEVIKLLEELKGYLILVKSYEDPTESLIGSGQEEVKDERRHTRSTIESYGTVQATRGGGDWDDLANGFKNCAYGDGCKYPQCDCVKW